MSWNSDWILRRREIAWSASGRFGICWTRKWDGEEVRRVAVDGYWASEMSLIVWILVPHVFLLDFDGCCDMFALWTDWLFFQYSGVSNHCNGFSDPLCGLWWYSFVFVLVRFVFWRPSHRKHRLSIASMAVFEWESSRAAVTTKLELTLSIRELGGSNSEFSSINLRKN